MASDRDVFVFVANVRAISDGLALICELPDNRRFAVPLHLIGPRSKVRNPGDAGTLEVALGFANDHGLPISNQEHYLPETPIAFDGVEMLATSGLGHTFRIGDKEVFVGSVVPLKGTSAFIVGQVGRLVLPRWFVEQHGFDDGTVVS